MSKFGVQSNTISEGLSLIPFFEIANNYTHFLYDSWQSDEDPAKVFPNATRCTQDAEPDGYRELYQIETDFAFYVKKYHGGTLYVKVVSDDIALAHQKLGEYRKLFPSPEPKEPDTVPVTFWTDGPQGAISRRRELKVPSLDEIKFNYPPSIRNELEFLVGDELEPGKGGQLILWHGPPGTGKTTALRALAREWKSWANFHYIVDPDRMFMANASYMMNVILDDSDDKWRVLILEDAGELITADAKRNVGQGLSRLLNIVDGMIGQGIQLLIVITTNEPMGKLNEAMTRPGRCLSLSEFRRFHGDEVAEWYEARGEAPQHTGEATLADLFAEVNQAHRTEKETKSFGFAP